MSVSLLAAVLIYPNLPSLDVLTDYRPKVPLRVFTADGALIGEYGDERRAIVKLSDVPKKMVQAILAAEDDRFYQHGGVDYAGVLRAGLADLTSGKAREGASTITMQVARNFFLSADKTLTRKFSEVLLALKIEHSLSKDKILELYINQIYLGQRAYGFGAAAPTYFGKPLSKLSLAEIAMLAGLPKAPSKFNPVVNFDRSRLRQQYVLRRMRDLKYITPEEYNAAVAEKLHIRRDYSTSEVDAAYVAEMARQMMFERYGDAAYGSGFRVYTTLSKADQKAASAAVRQGVQDYDRRHGYRGPEKTVDLPADSDAESYDEALQDFAPSNNLFPALVLDASPKRVQAYIKNGDTVTISGEGLQFAQRALGSAASPKQRIRKGAVVRVYRDAKGHWAIGQLPQVEAAFVALDPNDGAIRALVGGVDYGRNKFNHAIQAWRQPGSSFKPFIYSAALERGFTAASVINDAPISLNAGGGQIWEPKNFDNKYDGPIRLRTALTKSKNMVSIRILQSIGPRYAQDYITRFGFSPEQHPAYLTMALGAGAVTPMQMAAGYAVFANGGYRVKPYYIERIVDVRGAVLAQANPVRAGADRAIDPRNAFIMTSILQDVIKYGTATRAKQLGRADLAGKTGTTNDQVDAWFCGYSPTLVAVSWMGFDKPRSLGNMETGAQAALPIWISFMGQALKNVPEKVPTPPDGVVAAYISPSSGLRLPQGLGISEYFYQEKLPPEAPPEPEAPADVAPEPSEAPPDESPAPGF